MSWASQHDDCMLTCKGSVGLLQKVALRSPESLLKLRNTCLRLGNMFIEVGMVPVRSVKQVCSIQSHKQTASSKLMCERLSHAAGQRVCLCV